MTAVDTNVVVRLLTGDSPRQASAVAALLASGPIWIGKTVLLESNWVLRSVYGYDVSAVYGAFVKLLGLAAVEVEDPEPVGAALDLMANGVEFADAIHVCSRPQGVSFVTFDRSLVRRAQRAGIAAVAAVPPPK